MEPILDRVDAMRAFVRVAERRSFAQAAHDLAIPRSRVSEAVRQLEARLGVLLLTRTTRRVTPTAEGEDYHRRCVTILADIDDAEGSVAETVPTGLLRIEVHGTLARRFLLPGLPRFLDAHPGVSLHIGEGDTLIDLVRDGVDCVIRVGEPANSGLIGRQLAVLDEGTFASPAYLQRFGTPASPDDLDGHRMIGFVSSATRVVIPLEFQTPGGLRKVMLPTPVTVVAAATNMQLAVHGVGMIQVPRYRVAYELMTGALVEVLPQCPPTPTPVYILYPDGRQRSPRVRVFIDWVVREFADRLGSRST